MASDTQEALYRIFAALSGESATGAADQIGAAGPAAVVESAAEIVKSAAATVEKATAATAQTRSATAFIDSLTSGALGGAVAAATGASSKGQDEGSTAAAVAKTVLTSGFGIVPIVSALFGLFGGGDEEPKQLVKYALPAKLSFEAAETSSGLTDVAYDQSGAPRAVERDASSTGNLPQINVTVQAMDARSFLDRSGDIAAAVREAMLNLNSINDVITDL